MVTANAATNATNMVALPATAPATAKPIGTTNRTTQIAYGAARAYQTSPRREIATAAHPAVSIPEIETAAIPPGITSRMSNKTTTVGEGPDASTRRTIGSVIPPASPATETAENPNPTHHKGSDGRKIARNA